MNIPSIKIIDNEVIQQRNPHIRVYRIRLPYPIQSDVPLVGIDPGLAKLGFAHWCPGYQFIVLHLVKTSSKSDIISRLRSIRFASNKLPGGKVIIESASYGSPGKQIYLGLVRGLLIDRFINDDVRLLAPGSIRKKVFGSGKIIGKRVWKSIPPDCADALACLYATSNQNLISS